MPLETADWISELDVGNPPGGDQVLQGDDHLRLIKQVLINTFPNADKAFRFPEVETVSANMTFDLSDDNRLILFNSAGGGIQVNLPAALGVDNAGFKMFFMKVSNDENNVTLQAASINGIANFRFNAQWILVTVVWTGTAWVASVSSSLLTQIDHAQLNVLNGENREYPLITNASFGGVILTSSSMSLSGSGSASIYRNGALIAGGAHNIGTTLNTITRNVAFDAGDRISVVFSSVASLVGAQIVLKIQRGT